MLAFGGRRACVRGEKFGFSQGSILGGGGSVGSGGDIGPPTGWAEGRVMRHMGLGGRRTPVLNMLDARPSDVPHVTLDACGRVTSLQCSPSLLSHPKKEYS